MTKNRVVRKKCASFSQLKEVDSIKKYVVTLANDVQHIVTMRDKDAQFNYVLMISLDALVSSLVCKQLVTVEELQISRDRILDRLKKEQEEVKANQSREDSTNV